MNTVKKEHEMNEGKDKTVVRRALLWILVYIVLVNIGDEIGRQTGMGSLITALILVGFFSGLLLKTHRLKDLLLQLPERNVYARVWYFIPLLILALIQWFVGLEATLGLSDILIAALLMMAVGL